MERLEEQWLETKFLGQLCLETEVVLSGPAAVPDTTAAPAAQAAAVGAAA